MSQDDSIQVADAKLCFVVMGFGKKTDYETGRTLDLNATYREIIKPAAIAAGLRCIRADEVMHSGHIDLPMYEMLLRAELVIADISTGNPNALYELGVRHALKPFSTIIMKESKGKLHFDLNHTSTFSYDHLGEDIGASEARRAIQDLTNLVEEVLTRQQPDSPVYTFIPRLIQPRMSEEQIEALIQQSEDSEERFSYVLDSAEAALRSDHFEAAVTNFSAAAEVKPGDTYITQRLALSTYKSQQPSKIAALVNALKIINDLTPDDSNDPETLGIAGAIHKRLWKITEDPAELSLAIKYYGRGFDIRRDYYNGDNHAICLNYQSELESDPVEQSYYRVSARKTREELEVILNDIITSPSFTERSDQKWALASMAQVLFGLGRETEALQFEQRFLDFQGLAQWEIDTFNESKTDVLRLTNSSQGVIDTGA
ncbi:tetratricopeptide repeat-containing protein [Ralstonia pseudosolanacearum]